MSAPKAPPAPSELTAERRAALELLRQRRQRAARETIARVPRDGELPLSHAEQRLWFLARLEGDSGAYAIPMAWRFRGRLDVAALERSLDELVRRHETLRTTYPMVGGGPVRVIHPHAVRRLEVIALATLEPDAREASLRALVDEEAKRPFDLASGPLFRAKLVVLGAEDHALLLSLHHIVFDGWSLAVLRRELAALYAAFARGAPSPLNDLEVQYADFAAWQGRYLRGERLEKQLAFWVDALAGAPPKLELPTDHPRPAVLRFRGRRHDFLLGRPLTERVKARAREVNATPFMVLLAAYSALLARHTGEDDILVGSPIANRTEVETEGLIGCFINTIVLRTRPRAELTFRALLEDVKRTALAAYANQDLPFEQLIERLQPERSLSYAPVFQVMFILQSSPEGDVALPGITQSSIERTEESALFDLTLTMGEGPDGLWANFTYDVDLFDAATIERMAERFLTLLEGATDAPDLHLDALPLLPARERALVLRTFNATDAPLEPPLTIHGLFEAAARATPERTAASFEDQRTTYRALDRRAEQIAARLVELGVEPGALVGVCVERGLDLVAALLGTLKAGAAYVPLDPALPEAHLRFMREDSGMTALVVDERSRGRVDPGALPVLSLDGDPRLAALVDLPSPARRVDPEQRAYVLYTSGSTGRPKGVEISHRAVANLLASMRARLGFTAEDVLLAVTTISFDIAGLELFLPLTTGARVHLATRETAADGRALARLLAETGATFMQATPATWHLLLDAGWTGRGARGDLSLTICCGGEALPLGLARRLVERGRAVFNLYGPTETTIWSSLAQLDAEVLAREDAAITVGRPIANTALYVLDRALRPVPIGVAGDLYIGGAGLALGYLGRPELTAAAFLPHPFAEELTAPEDARVYATGDRARWLANGELELLGRRDGQVKVRGFRIELGEIEAVASEHPDVRDVVALVREGSPGDRRLVAYVTSKSGALDVAALKQLLDARLPEYMVPWPIVVLPELPLTPNGKLDRRALLARSDAAAVGPARPSATPRNATERRLERIYAEVLGCTAVSTDASFFELGGHSLRAVTLLDRIERAFGRTIPLMALFRGPSIREVAALLDSGRTSTTRALEAIQPAGARPPLFFVGSTLYARRLVPYLGPEQPVYGLNIFGLEPLADRRSRLDVRAIARAYLDEIRSAEPRGPYRIAAYCADAKLALEIAAMVQEEGDAVALLAFVDTVWPGDRESAGGGAYATLLNVLDFGPRYLVHRARRRLRHYGDRTSTALRTLETRRLELQGRPLPTSLRHMWLIHAYLGALSAHPPPTFDGRIVIYQSRETRRSYPAAIEAVATRGLEVEEVPGYHDEVFTSPNLEVLGRKLAARLEALLPKR